jgi:hypothetical protein
MAIPFDEVEHPMDVIETADEAPTELGGLRRERLRTTLTMAWRQPLPQRVVHSTPKRDLPALLVGQELGGHVRVQRDGRTHTSVHNTFDALMPRSMKRKVL